MRNSLKSILPFVDKKLYNVVTHANTGRFHALLYLPSPKKPKTE